MPIRVAELTDAMALAQVRVTSWKSAYHGLLPASFLDRLAVEDGEARWKEILTEGQTKTLVYEQDDNVVGFVCFGESRDDDVKGTTGEVHGIYLLPNVWRQGYGRALLTKALKSLRRQGFSEVTLWVLNNNHRAIGFYEATGFKADGATKVVTIRDGVKLHEVRYRRPLSCHGQKICGRSMADRLDRQA